MLTPKQKMLRLAAYLEDHVPPSDFNMGIWKCGTVGCAMGHAVTLFPDELTLCPSHITHHFFVVSKFGGYHGFKAAAKLFNIHLFEAQCLFCSDYVDGNELVRKSQDYVVNHLRNFANQKWPDEIVEEIIEKTPVCELQDV